MSTIDDTLTIDKDSGSWAVLTPQQLFDKRYVSTAEIATRCGVSKVAVTHAIKRQNLPAPILHGQLHFWERDKVEPFIEAWCKALTARRALRTVGVGRGQALAPYQFKAMPKALTSTERSQMRAVQLPESDDYDTV